LLCVRHRGIEIQVLLPSALGAARPRWYVALARPDGFEPPTL